MNKPEPLKGIRRICPLHKDGQHCHLDVDIRSAAVWLKKQFTLSMNYDKSTIQSTIDKAFEDVMK